VPNNTDEHSYGLKVRFIKRCLFGHVASVVITTLCAIFITLPLTDPQLATILFGVLIALTTIRFVFKAGRTEQLLSSLIMLAAMPLIGQLAKDIQLGGFPIVAIPITSLLIGIYTAAVGRDFSFPGLVGVCSTVLAVVLWILRAQGVAMVEMVALGWFFGTAYVAYIAYDLAMILRRRTPSEIPSVVADFLRDLLNFLTYPARVIVHWRGYKFQ